jgi:hypothetical protein
MAFGVQNYAEFWPRPTTAKPLLEPFTEDSIVFKAFDPSKDICATAAGASAEQTRRPNPSATVCFII